MREKLIKMLNKCLRSICVKNNKTSNLKPPISPNLKNRLK